MLLRETIWESALTLTRCRRRCSWGGRGRPPTRSAVFMRGRPRISSCACLSICMASSRVGVRTSAAGPVLCQGRETRLRTAATRPRGYQPAPQSSHEPALSPLPVGPPGSKPSRLLPTTEFVCENRHGENHVSHDTGRLCGVKARAWVRRLQ